MWVNFFAMMQKRIFEKAAIFIDMQMYLVGGLLSGTEKYHLTVKILTLEAT